MIIKHFLIFLFIIINIKSYCNKSDKSTDVILAKNLLEEAKKNKYTKQVEALNLAKRAYKIALQKKIRCSKFMQ